MISENKQSGLIERMRNELLSKRQDELELYKTGLTGELMSIAHTRKTIKELETEIAEILRGIAVLTKLDRIETLTVWMEKSILSGGDLEDRRKWGEEKHRLIEKLRRLEREELPTRKHI